MSVKRTTAASAAKGKTAAKRRASGTDWTRLRGMSDAEAARGAARDRDTHQSRMNAVLRAFVEHQRQSDGPPKRKRVG